MFERQLAGSIFDFIELIAVEEQVKVENHQMSVCEWETRRLAMT